MKAVTRMEAAKELSVSVTTVDRLRGAGEIDTIRIGGRANICPASLADYVERQRSGSPNREAVEAGERRIDPANLPIRVLDEARARKAAARAYSRRLGGGRLTSGSARKLRTVP